MLTEYKKILVALDGSVQSEKAFKESIEIAKRNAATLYLTWIINDIELTTSAYSFAKLLTEEQAFVEDFMVKKVQELKDEGIEKVETIVEIGSPKRKIAVDVPDEYGIDLIIMGSTGKGAITQALVGSTTSYVVNHAPCNVMVIK
ncbi:universal stress protein [Enterococcus sp. LJL98]